MKNKDGADGGKLIEEEARISSKTKHDGALAV